MGKDASAPHGHPAAAKYDFSEDRHMGVFLCSHVANQSPVLFVSHDADGDWQFLCGAPHDEAEGARLVCLEQVVAADPGLNALSKLPRGQQAQRAKIGGEWAVSDPSEAFIQQAVEQFGWAVQSIDESRSEPAFSYTIGLHKSFQHPELIVFGLPHEAAQRLLNIVGERIRAGTRFEQGVAYADLVHGHDVRFRAAEDPKSLHEHVGYALWYYQGEPFELLQVVWPDAKGAFPDAAQAPAWLRKSQPLLA